MSKSLDMGCDDIPHNPFWADELFRINIQESLERDAECADLAFNRIPFPDDYFDYVSAYDFLDYLPRVIYKARTTHHKSERLSAFVELMNEVYRVLKPGGLFLSVTPAVTNGIDFPDSTRVISITDEKFSIYFDDTNRLASIYGFCGAFKFNLQEHKANQCRAILKKIEFPEEAKNPVSRNSTISIFIPVYNGEKYLAKTLDSLLSQTFEDFEVICVNDCSTDASEQILQSYAVRDCRVRILKTPCNQGSATNICNFALQHMNGGYFVYSSQDDLFSENWLEKMHHRAFETGADAVIPELVFFYEYELKKCRSIKGLNGDISLVINGREAMEKSLDWQIVGNALWNIEIVRKLGFETFAVNADEFSVRRFFLHCNKVVFSEGTFYFRQDNDQAITKKRSANSFDWPYTQLRLAQLLLEYSFSIKLAEREFQNAIVSMNKLQKWFEVNRHKLTNHEIDSITTKIHRFNERIDFIYPFSIPFKRRKFPAAIAAKFFKKIILLHRKTIKFLGNN